MINATMMIVSMPLEMLLNLKGYAYLMGGGTATGIMYEEFSLYEEGKPLPLDKALENVGFFLDHQGEVYFNKDRHQGTLPLEIRERLQESRWCPVNQTYICPGSVSFNIQTPLGALARIGYMWFDKGRWSNNQSVSSP